MSVAIALLLVVVVIGCGLKLGALLIAHELSLRLPRLPRLPAADAPPAGLSGHLPVGGQVDLEVWHGLQDLDQWLRTQAARP